MKYNVKTNLQRNGNNSSAFYQAQRYYERVLCFSKSKYVTSMGKEIYIYLSIHCQIIISCF